jgi:hypothetical protein
MSSPVHPSYEMEHPVFNSPLQDHLPSIEEWKDWFELNFIIIDETRTKREILRWYAKQRGMKRSKFFELQKQAKSLNEMVDLVWPPDDDK